jgi:hypothetical protein
LFALFNPVFFVPIIRFIAVDQLINTKNLYLYLYLYIRWVSEEKKYISSIWSILARARESRKRSVYHKVDSTFRNPTPSCLSLKEKNAWIPFKNFVKGFLRNKKDDKYREIGPELLQNFHQMGGNMSL